MPEDLPVEDRDPASAPGSAAESAPPGSGAASATSGPATNSPLSTAPLGIARAARVRWFRRRPPAEFDRFGRVVWWFGQAQLFIALASLPVGLALILWGVVGAPRDSATGAVFLGTTLVALPGPIAISGLMLRGRARGLASLTGARRWIALVGWIALIALIASIAAIAAVFLVVLAFVVVSGMAGGTF